MTPKEKADQLYRYYIDYTQGYYNCKECCLIAVDEIIDCTKNGLGLTKFSKEYWQEVKQEIINYKI